MIIIYKKSKLFVYVICMWDFSFMSYLILFKFSVHSSIECKIHFLLVILITTITLEE